MRYRRRRKLDDRVGRFRLFVTQTSCRRRMRPSVPPFLNFCSGAFGSGARRRAASALPWMQS